MSSFTIQVDVVLTRTYHIEAESGDEAARKYLRGDFDPDQALDLSNELSTMEERPETARLEDVPMLGEPCPSCGYQHARWAYAGPVPCPHCGEDARLLYCERCGHPNDEHIGEDELGWCVRSDDEDED